MSPQRENSGHSIGYTIHEAPLVRPLHLPPPASNGIDNIISPPLLDGTATTTTTTTVISSINTTTTQQQQVASPSPARVTIIKNYSVTDLTQVPRMITVDPEDLNPLKPCGACMEWLKKIAENNPRFTVVTFTDENCTGVYTESISTW